MRAHTETVNYVGRAIISLWTTRLVDRILVACERYGYVEPKALGPISQTLRDKIMATTSNNAHKHLWRCQFRRERVRKLVYKRSGKLARKVTWPIDRPRWDRISLKTRSESDLGPVKIPILMIKITVRVRPLVFQFWGHIVSRGYKTETNCFSCWITTLFSESK